MAKSRAKIDVSQVAGFAVKLDTAAALADEMAESWQQEHGENWAQEMRATAPVDTGRLRGSIRQVEPGGITMGDAFWWRFLEYGTTKMSPRPFVNPAMKRIRTPARKDATQRAIDLLRGRGV